MKIRKINLKTRIALTYSLIILLACLSILLLTNLYMRRSLNKLPIIKAISPNAISITINRETDSSLSYYIPIESEELIRELSRSDITADSFNNMLNNNVLQRVFHFSLLTSLIIGLLSILIAVHYSKKISAPIVEILKVTDSISINNMTERITIPSKYDESSQIISLYNNALDKLQESFQDLEQFNSYASHELRNSLALLRACLEQGQSDDEIDIKQALKQANEYIIKLTHTVDDIMALSSRQLKDCNEPVDLALLAAEAVDEYNLSGINLELILPEEGVPPVYGKEIWLYRVICNLIDNALKHSMDYSPVIIEVKQKFNAVILSVKDHGKGISDQSIDHIWQPYYSKPAPGKGGVGLGLAMVKQVISSLGGFTWVDSMEAEGSTFYISLPVIHP